MVKYGMVQNVFVHRELINFLFMEPVEIIVLLVQVLYNYLMVNAHAK